VTAALLAVVGVLSAASVDGCANDRDESRCFV
jgi:hypothetical protein